MSGPERMNTISTGNLITIAVVIATAAASFATTQTNLTSLEKQIVEIEQAAISREARIRALELGAGRVDEKLINILSVLARIETQINQQNGARP